MAFWACYLSGDSRIVPQILDTCPLNPWVLQPILDEVHKKMEGCSDRKGGEGLQEVRLRTPCIVFKSIFSDDFSSLLFLELSIINL